MNKIDELTKAIKEIDSFCKEIDSLAEEFNIVDYAHFDNKDKLINKFKAEMSRKAVYESIANSEKIFEKIDRINFLYVKAESIVRYFIENFEKNTFSLFVIKNNLFDLLQTELEKKFQDERQESYSKLAEEKYYTEVNLNINNDFCKLTFYKYLGDVVINENYVLLTSPNHKNFSKDEVIAELKNKCENYNIFKIGDNKITGFDKFLGIFEDIVNKKILIHRLLDQNSF